MGRICRELATGESASERLRTFRRGSDITGSVKALDPVFIGSWGEEGQNGEFSTKLLIVMRA